MRVPRGAFHWRVERNGYVPADLVTGTPGNSLRFNLQADNAPHRDVIRIPGGEVRLWVLGGVSAAHSVSLGAFLIDRREVTTGNLPNLPTLADAPARNSGSIRSATAPGRVLEACHRLLEGLDWLDRWFGPPAR